MAPLPINSTARVLVDYTVNSRSHVMSARVGAPEDADVALGAMADILSALGGSNCVLLIAGARFIAEGSDVSIPIVWPGDTSYGSGAATDRFAASYQSFVGRDTGGKRVRFTVFGFAGAGTDDNFRAPEEDTGRVTEVLTILRETEGCFITIGGSTAIWNPYVNTGENAHFRDKFR